MLCTDKSYGMLFSLKFIPTIFVVRCSVHGIFGKTCILRRLKLTPLHPANQDLLSEDTSEHILLQKYFCSKLQKKILGSWPIWFESNMVASLYHNNRSVQLFKLFEQVSLVIRWVKADLIPFFLYYFQRRFKFHICFYDFKSYSRLLLSRNEFIIRRRKSM